MAKSRLRSLAADVESQVDLPDFAVVAARGARIRRRRSVIAGAVAALAVALSLVGLAHTFDADRTVQPVHRPAPAIDQQGARRVLADPDAYVDPDATRVDGDGAMLAVVVGARDRSLGDGSGTCTDAGKRSALRWTGADGDTHAWLERVRYVGPVPGGFVVAAAPCRRPDGRSDGRTYLVDESGTPRSIVWGSGAARVCAARPGDVRCSFDVRTRRGAFHAAVALPDGAVPLSPGTAGPRWARSRDGRGLFWSEDGRTWRHRDTGRPGGAIVSASAAGRWGMLAEHNRCSSPPTAAPPGSGATWRGRSARCEPPTSTGPSPRPVCCWVSPS